MSFSTSSTIVQEKVSIIIPSLNPNELLFETIDCIRKQTYPNIEIVFVNDGTTNPSSLGIIQTLKENNPDVKIVTHGQNKGLPAARNTGIKAAAGDFIFFLDGDDLIAPTAIEKHYLTLQNNPSFDFVNCFVIGFGTQSYEWRGGFHDGETFLYENRNTSTFMTRRSIFQKVSFDESLRHGCEDWDFWLNVASKGLWGYTIPEFLFYYRRSDNADRWQVLSSASTIEKFGVLLRQKYEAILRERGFPQKRLPGYKYTIPVVPPAQELQRSKNEKENRVLVIFPWLEIGGADKFNLDLLSGMKERGWNITILCTLNSPHPWLQEFQKLTDDIFLLYSYTSPHEYYKSIYYFLQTRDIKLVFISNSLYGYYLLPFLKSSFPQVPVVDCIHCEEAGWLNGGYPRISNSFSGLIDRTIVTTGHLKNYMEEMRQQEGISGAPIEVCYTNIDHKIVKKNYEYRKEIRESWSINENFTVILFSARMVEQKQPLVLAEAIGRLLKMTDNFVCIVLGDGPLLPAFKEYVYNHKLEKKIWCMGSVKHEEHLKYMDAADVFFLPSAIEGIAITLYESMAKELVVVGAAVGGQAELVDENCGYLINRSTPSSEAETYANILFELISDTTKRDHMKIQARKKIESQFGMDQMHSQMHNSLLEVSQQPVSTSPVQLNQYFLFMLGLFINEEMKSNILWNDFMHLKQQHPTPGEVLVIEPPSNSLVGIDELTWTKQEYSKLKDWYGQQYDILPLWYKRFGHIIKVVKGKRSVRSLFK
jgi:glycosyltransferase involved in cell wall biosynthesis